MKVSLPQDICQQISTRAVQLAREDIKGRGWSNSSADSLDPFSQEGTVGIRTSVRYLLHQERGIKPFLMYWVDGRTVPLKGPNGTTSFRRGGHVGEPGWVTLPGGVRKWRDQRWRHPGLAPKSFLQTALEKAIKEAQPNIKQMMMDALKGKTNA